MGIFLLLLFISPLILQFVISFEADGIGNPSFNFPSDERSSSNEILQFNEFERDARVKIIGKRETHTEVGKGKETTMTTPSLPAVAQTDETKKPVKRIKKKVKRKQTTTVKPSDNLVLQNMTTPDNATAITGRNIIGQPQHVSPITTVKPKKGKVRRVYVRRRPKIKHQTIAHVNATTPPPVPVKPKQTTTKVDINPTSQKPLATSPNITAASNPKAATPNVTTISSNIKAALPNGTVPVVANSAPLNGTAPKRNRRQAQFDTPQENLGIEDRHFPYSYPPPDGSPFPPQQMQRQRIPPNLRRDELVFMGVQPPQHIPWHFHIPLLPDYPQDPPSASTEELMAAENFRAPTTYASKIPTAQNVFIRQQVTRP